MKIIPNFNNLENLKDFSQPLESLFSDIIAPDNTGGMDGEGIGTDNMTAIVVYFKSNIN